MLEVKNLGVQYSDRDGAIRIVEDINFSVQPGQVFALIGESGSGKSTLAYSLTRLFTPRSGYAVSGEVSFEGRNLLQLNERLLRQVRQSKIRYIFQEPSQVLNPIYRIKTQYSFPLEGSGNSAADHSPLAPADILGSVGIENQDEVLRSYPHELSGGTLQRVLIAMALAARPRLIIADEPTSSVDAPLQYQLLDRIDQVRKDGCGSVLLITHNLHVAHRYADMIAVMYAGRIVEIAPKQNFFKSPLHPYAKALVSGNYLESDSAPNTAPPHPSNMPNGCKFHPVCAKAQSVCRTDEPQLVHVDIDREVRCPFWK